QELPRFVAAEYDAVLLLAPTLTAAGVDGAERLKVVARFGVGYDSVDVDACTRNGILLTITPDGVRRPVAASMVLYLLAMGHKLLIKDRITRAGRWHDRLDHMGVGLTGRTLGLVGLGNIGAEVCRLIAPFGMHVLAADPHASPAAASAVGAEIVGLDTLLARADFVGICCALTPETHHLINAERLARMKPTAFLVNVARGPIVDQAALTQVLQEGRIAGAALDVFEQEPVDPNDPILALENVIVAPHAICWTDECFRGNGTSACQSVVDVFSGRAPRSIVNRDALSHPRLRDLLRA
ncbi:MAG: dehydrogenase, partial [SAR202 cluster bacterium]|nr:dehydrogenase [SAR202 cluster bacterium]